MSHRLPVLVTASLAASLAAVAAAPPAAAVPICHTVPGSTIGFTVGAAGEQVRVPAISDISVCLDDTGSYGWAAPVVVNRTGCGTPCLDVRWHHGTYDSKVVVRYRADGVLQTTTHDIPPITVGLPTDTCVFGIGSPANETCLTFLTVG